jgi:hypothetical protein
MPNKARVRLWSAVKSLPHSAMINRLDACAYLHDRLERLLTGLARRATTCRLIAASAAQRRPDRSCRRQDGMASRMV